MTISRADAVDSAISCVSRSRSIFERALDLENHAGPIERRHLDYWDGPGKFHRTEMTNHRLTVERWVKYELPKTVYLKFSRSLFRSVCYSYFDATLAITGQAIQTFCVISRWAQSFGESPWSTDHCDDYGIAARIAIAQISQKDIEDAFEVEAGLNDEYKRSPMLARCQAWEANQDNDKYGWRDVALEVEGANLPDEKLNDYGKETREWAKKNGIVLTKKKGGRKRS